VPARALGVQGSRSSRYESRSACFISRAVIALPKTGVPGWKSFARLSGGASPRSRTEASEDNARGARARRHGRILTGTVDRVGSIPGKDRVMATSVSAPTTTPYDSTRVVQDGIIAGVLAAAAVALWFFVFDAVRGRPLYTPSVLGTVLFGRDASLGSLEATPVSLDKVLMFTWMHGLVFAVLGAFASWLLAVAERSPHLGFGIVLLFVIFEACFTATAYFIAAPILHALAWPAVIVANLLAAAVMAAYLWWRHQSLQMEP
jgi:hypothetical protein